ncbi:MAG: biotin--[acetyl-CoA-carboxylase] ligase [Cyclobacteriaceae bacterium]
MHKIFANSLFIGKKLEILPHCQSTNKTAINLINTQSPPDGTIILTENQTDGRGQRGNKWQSAAGKNLTCTFIMKPHFLAIQDQFALNMISSLAVLKGVNEMIGKTVKVKWPNDVYVGDMKIAGILVENVIRGTRIDYSAIGIGLNINQLEFENPKATSMKDLTLVDFDIYKVLETIGGYLESYYLTLKSDPAEVKKQYLKNLYWINEPHVFKHHELFTGRIQGIDGTGKLLIEHDERQEAFDIKEVEFIE